MHPDGRYRVAVGAKHRGLGTAHLYAFSPSDVHHGTAPEWTYIHELYTAAGIPDDRLQGMWECPDFFSIPVEEKKNARLRGAAASEADESVYVFKASSDGHDWYALGTYDTARDQFVPVDSKGTLWLDGGMFYASKSFHDSKNRRQVLMGWVQESLENRDPHVFAWDGLQAFPRELSIEAGTGYLLQSPVREINLLRDTHTTIHASLTPNSIVPIIGGVMTQDRPNQYELTVEFSWPSYHAHRSLPEFGVRVFEDPASGEVTVIRVKPDDGLFAIAIDRSDSSANPDADESLLITTARMEKEETSMRLQVLADRGIVEVFAAGGRGVVTGRVYPTSSMAVQGSAFVGQSRLGLRELSAGIDLWSLADAKVIVD